MTTQDISPYGIVLYQCKFVQHQLEMSCTFPRYLPQLNTIPSLWIWIYFLFYVAFNSQGHIAMGRLRVEEPVHISWSRFCTINHRASASNYQLSNMKYPVWDLNRLPPRLKASTLTAVPPSPHAEFVKGQSWDVPDCELGPNNNIIQWLTTHSAFHIPGCPSNQEWSECGYACNMTCGEQLKVCATVCREGCECPDRAPLWHLDQCVSRDQCPNTGKTNSLTASPWL